MQPRVQLLLADDDAAFRSLLASSVAAEVDGLTVLEAADGSEAIQLGLQRRPQIALLDVNMPRLGGIEAAVTLRELQPRMRIALHSGDPSSHRERARSCGLALFDKAELDGALAWLSAHARACRGLRPRRRNLASIEP